MFKFIPAPGTDSGEPASASEARTSMDKAQRPASKGKSLRLLATPVGDYMDRILGLGRGPGRPGLRRRGRGGGGPLPRKIRLN
jgi:hypothetical protein